MARKRTEDEQTVAVDKPTGDVPADQPTQPTDEMPAEPKLGRNGRRMPNINPTRYWVVVVDRGGNVRRVGTPLTSLRRAVAKREEWAGVLGIECSTAYVVRVKLADPLPRYLGEYQL